MPSLSGVFIIWKKPALGLRFEIFVSVYWLCWVLGCEGAPGSLGLRLDELESEEEDDEDEDDQDDDDDYDDEEGIDICCPEELAQVLEMPVSLREKCNLSKEKYCKVDEEV